MLANGIQPGNRNFVEYLINSQCKSFYLSPVSPTAVENIISSLNTSKAVGPHNIPVKIFKLLKRILCYPLSYLSNYRPITLLSVFHKIMEKLMFN